MSTRILAIGGATLDRVWFVETLPASGTKVRASSYMEVGGGQAANAAVTAARLGGRVALWSAVGDDAAGTTILRELRAEHVDVSGVTVLTGVRSITAAVIVDANGERTIVSDVDPALRSKAFQPDLSAIGSMGAVLADVKWPALARPALEEARRCGVPVVLDIEPAPADHLTQLSPLADHAIFSRSGLAAYTGTADPESGLAVAFARIGRVVGVTLGAEGVRLMSAQGQVRVPAPRVAVVDTTGAGDAFHGAYALAIAEGMEAVAAARFSNAVAAMKCTRRGGRSGLPTRPEIDAFMAAM